MKRLLTLFALLLLCLALFSACDEKDADAEPNTEANTETETHKHEWKDAYSYDKTHHWKKCKSCNDTTEHIPHTLNASNRCSGCNQSFTPTEGIVYTLSSSGTYATVTGYNGSSADVVIASKYKNVPVTSVGELAFEDRKDITTVIIPESVTAIEWAGFYRCSGLTSIAIPASVTTIGKSAFSGCSGLTSITISGVTSIEASAFFSCSGLTSVTIPASVTFIGQRAFAYCTSLTSVTFKKTSGWRHALSPTDTSGVEFPSDYLSDTSTAAKYLTFDYSDYNWRRG